MKINLIILSLLPIFFLSVNAQTVLYNEDFSNQTGKGVIGSNTGAVFDTTAISWSIDTGFAQLTASTDYLNVNASNQMEARDVGGHIIWYSDTIDISTFAAVNLSIDISETGGMDNPDYLNVYYILDNGAPQPFENNGLNSGVFGSLTATSDSIFGGTVQITVTVRNNANSERHFFDNIMVTENIAEIQSFYDLPDQSSILLKWSDPLSVFDEVLIVANLNSAISAGKPIGNGSAYTADSILGTGTSLLGGSVVYKGVGNSFSVFGVNPSDTCFIKAFTRKGTTWSVGTELKVFYNPPTLGDIKITEYARHSSISDYSYLEIYNTTNSDISLAGGKIIANNLASVSKVIDIRTEISKSVIVPANGFLILNRDRSQTFFETEWNVDLTNTGFPVNYIRTGENNFGNYKFFQYKQGGTEDTNDGDLIDESTNRPSIGQRVFQLPFNYWNKMGSVADSATPGYFADIENPIQIDLAYTGASWFPYAPSSSTGTKNAVIITGNATFVDGSELFNLTIWSNAGTDITTENIIVSNNLIIKNNGSLTITGNGSLDGVTNTTVSRIGLNTDTDYNIWGSPIDDSTDILGTFSSVNPCDIYVFEASSQQYKYDYDTNQTITCFGNSFSLTSIHVITNLSEGEADGYFDIGRGYFIPGDISNTISFSGFMSDLNNGTINVPVFGSSGSVIGGSNDWNLISNPYPSAVSANSFILSNLGLITNAIYVYDQGLNSGSFTTINSTDGFNIASCQGFFVDANSNTNGLLGNISFTNAMRNNQNDDFRSNSDLHAIYLAVSNPQNQKDVMRIYFDENAEKGFDYVYDANKMMNVSFNLASVVDGRNVVFNGIPELTVEPRIIPLYFNTSSQNTFTITIDSIIGDFTGKDIILEDRFLRKFHTINAKSYSFQTDSNEWSNRFFLHIQNASSPTGIENLESKTVKILSLENAILVTILDENSIINSVEILDVKGQLITSITGNSNTVSVPVTGISAGVYLVKYFLNTGNSGVRKIVIQ